MQMQVEDDTSPCRKSRKAKIRVVSRAPKHQLPGPVTEGKASSPREELEPLQKGQAAGHVSKSGAY